MSDIFRVFIENEAAIKRFLKRFSSASNKVDDYAQETFLRGFAAETRTQIKEPKAFLFQVARNVVLTDARKDSRSAIGHLQHEDDIAEVIDERQATSEEWIDGRRKLTLLSKAVAQLSPQCRKAFLLRRVDGLHYKQIANRMGISVSGVEKHVTNGLLKCNRYLSEQGYDPTEFGAAIKAAKTATPKQINQLGQTND